MALSKSKSNPLLQTLLYFIPLFLILANKVHSQQDTFFYFGYPDNPFPQNPTDLIYEGDARVQPGNTTLSLAGIDSNGKSRTGSVGRVLWSKPVQFWDRFGAGQADFETSITFFINPSTNGSAEGIAFFIASYDNPNIPDIDNSVGGNLGIYDGSTTDSIFAVEFDTNINEWDPAYNHIGINIQSRNSNNVTRFDAGTGQEVYTNIKYNSNTTIITVAARSLLDDSIKATLSYVFNLTSILPERVLVGIASSTGLDDSIIGLPEIRQWYFNSVLMNEDDAYIRQTVSI